MKKLVLLFVSVAFGSAAVGFLFAAMTTSPPGDWLAIQEDTGRPPKIIALLTLAPIIVVGVLVVIKYVYRTIRKKR